MHFHQLAMPRTKDPRPRLITLPATKRLQDEISSSYDDLDIQQKGYFHAISIRCANARSSLHSIFLSLLRLPPATVLGRRFNMPQMYNNSDVNNSPTEDLLRHRLQSAIHFFPKFHREIYTQNERTKSVLEREKPSRSSCSSSVISSYKRAD